MAVNWAKIHVGFKPASRKLFIGRVDAAGRVEESDDRTEEIVMALMRKMRYKVRARNKPEKPWFGYRDKELGQLIYIDGDYLFTLNPPRTPIRR